MKTKTATTSTVKEKKPNMPPKGAEILEETVRTETEEIENGFLTTKSWNGRYREKGKGSDSYGNYYNYSKKWFTKEDPLTININDKALADNFNEEDDKD